jgi:hypothetical protein
MKHIKLISAQSTLDSEGILAILDRVFTFVLDFAETTGKDKSGV